MSLRTLDSDGMVVSKGKMTYAGETSIFEGIVSAAAAKTIEVLASQPDEANFGKVAAVLE